MELCDLSTDRDDNEKKMKLSYGGISWKANVLEKKDVWFWLMDLIMLPSKTLFDDLV
jgi:hypothetical protein